VCGGGGRRPSPDSWRGPRTSLGIPRAESASALLNTHPRRTLRPTQSAMFAGSCFEGSPGFFPGCGVPSDCSCRASADHNSRRHSVILTSSSFGITGDDLLLALSPQLLKTRRPRIISGSQSPGRPGRPAH
jgi:hypothetical protein